jgi:hypothetical protein
MHRSHNIAKRKIASGSSLQANISRAKHRIRTAAIPQREVVAISIEFPVDQIPEAVKALANDPELRNLIVGIPFQKNSEHLEAPTDFYTSQDLPKYIYWQANIFNLFSTELNDFLENRAKYEASVLEGGHDEAEAILTEIDTAFGISRWSIENRITLLQMQHGLERQKDYTKHLSETCNNGILRQLAILFSLKAEENVTTDMYLKEIDSMTMELRAAGLNVQADYFDFQSRGFVFNSKADFAGILQNEVYASLIDRYLTFIRVCQCLCISTRDNYLIKRLSKSLQVLNKNVIDYRITRMLQCVDPDFVTDPSTISTDFVDILDHYTAGNYEEVVDLACANIAKERFDVSTSSIFAKANSRAKLPGIIDYGKGLASTIVCALKALFADRSQLLTARQSLLKICYLYKSHNWSSDLYRIIVSECDMSHGFTLLPSEKYALINARLINPHLALVAREKATGINLLDTISKNKKGSVTVALTRACLLLRAADVAELNIDAARSLKYQAEIYEAIKCLDQALSLYEKLKNNDDAVTRESAGLGIVRVLLASRRLKECAVRAAEMLILNDALYRRIDVPKILKEIELDGSEALKSSIAVPILYDIVTKKNPNLRDIRRLEAYEDFLILNGISRPSELRKYHGTISAPLLIYFLRYICIQKVMDISPVFEGGSEEVENERVSVCHILAEMDQGNASIYAKEIDSITDSLILARQQHLVQSQKIYVDVEQLKSSLYQSLGEQYQRYCALPPGDENAPEEKYISNNLFGVEVTQPAGAKEHLLIYMYQEVCSQFAMNQQYGLNVALSAEIRHGNIASSLRNPLEKLHLVTRIGRDGKYMHSDYWADQYGYVNDKLIEKIIERLKRFSGEIDELILLVRDQWVQIQINPYEEGSEAIFDFQCTTDDVMTIKRSLKSDTPFDEFFDLLLSHLWSKTDSSLLSARQKIGEDLMRMMLSKIDDLTADIREIKRGASLNDLEGAIASGRTAIQMSIEEIVGWFTRSEPGECADFDLHIPVDIAFNTARARCNHKGASISVKLPNNQLFQGRLLKPLTNIFIMIFVNAIEHSGLDDESDITMDAIVKDESIILKVRNKLNANVDRDGLEAKLAKKRAALNDGEYGEFANRDRGSGLFKIHKILFHDTNAAKHFSFSYEPPDEFLVLIELDRVRVISENIVN